MKKTLCLVALLFALCFVGVFAVTAGAEAAEPSLSIDYVNLSFSDAVYIKYAVAAEGVNASDVRLLVWREADTNGYAYGTQDETILPAYTDTIEEKKYIIFDYKNLAAKEMGDDVYVRAAVTVDGKTTVSAVNKFSVLQYANAVLGGNYATTLKDLMSDMLSYGASAQAHFNYKTARPVDGTWYTVNVVNGKLADGFATGLHMAGDTVTLAANAAPEDKIFSHWEDATGAKVSTDATFTPSVSASTTYTAIYADEGTDEEIVLNKLAYAINADGTTCTITGLGTCAGPVINIPAEIDGYTVTAIGEKAFADQATLTAINIPETVKTIGLRAFYGCKGLTEITIPASVTSIGTQIFYKCDNLKTVYYNSTYSPSDNPFLSIPSIEKVVFGGKYVPGQICQNSGNIKTVVIKDSVTSIGWYAFEGCTSLTSITIPDSVTSIGSYAFQYCDSLSSITIPDSVTSIGSYAFMGCTSLTSITIPDSVTSISAWAFWDCTNLTSITIPDSVTSIGANAFRDCTSLTSITIPDSVTSIGTYAFYYCASLTSVTIPDSVRRIGGEAFNCTSLTTVYYEGTVAEWNAISFDSNSYLHDGATHYYYSATQPTGEGNYWHYVDGVPTAW